MLKKLFMIIVIILLSSACLWAEEQGVLHNQFYEYLDTDGSLIGYYQIRINYSEVPEELNSSYTIFENSSRNGNQDVTDYTLYYISYALNIIMIESRHKVDLQCQYLAIRSASDTYYRIAFPEYLEYRISEVIDDSSQVGEYTTSRIFADRYEVNREDNVIERRWTDHTNTTYTNNLRIPTDGFVFIDQLMYYNIVHGSGWAANVDEPDQRWIPDLTFSKYALSLNSGNLAIREYHLLDSTSPQIQIVPPEFQNDSMYFVESNSQVDGYTLMALNREGFLVYYFSEHYILQICDEAAINDEHIKMMRSR